MSDLSKKAQEIRKLVLKTPEERASEKADEVFDWILSYFQKRNEVGLSENSLTFFYSKKEISTFLKDSFCYDDEDEEVEYEEILLKSVTSRISLDGFLAILKARIEREEGFVFKKCEETDRFIVTIE